MTIQKSLHLFILFYFMHLSSLHSKEFNAANKFANHLVENLSVDPIYPEDIIKFFYRVQTIDETNKNYLDHTNIKSLTHSYLNYVWGNKKFNKWLQYSELNNIDEFKQIIDVFIQLSHKTQFSYAPLEHKVLNILSKLKSQDLIPHKEKLKISDMRTAMSLKNLNPIFEELKKWQIYELLLEHQSFKDLVKQTKNISYFLNILSNEARKHDQIYNGLSIISYDFSTDFSYRNLTKAKYLFLKSLYSVLVNSNSEHISISIQDKNNTYESHMWGKPSRYSINQRPISSYFYHSYQLKLTSLIPAESKNMIVKKLQLLYGSQWNQTLNKIFKDIAIDYFFKQEHFKDLHNPQFRRFQSIVGYNIKPTQKSQDELKEFSRSGKTTCSEFVAKAIVHLIDFLNEAIKSDWSSSSQKGQAPYLEFPIKDTYKLKRMTPQKYFNTLHKNHLIEHIPFVPIIEQTIQLKAQRLKL